MVALSNKPPNQGQRIERLEEEIRKLKQECEWLKSILSGLFGIDGLWMSPDKAGKCISMSRDRIMQEIRNAEEARSKGQKTLFEYGKHYRNDQDVDSVTATWKVNVKEVDSYFKIPPDQRRIYK